MQWSDSVGPDATFQAWPANLVTYANANIVALGLTAADLARITATQTIQATALPTHIAA